jgi:hypothetical protein
MYLLPAGSSARSATKGLSAFRLRNRRLSCCGLGQDTIYITTGPEATLPSATVPDAPLTIDQINAIYGPGAPPVPAAPAGPAQAYANLLATAQTSQNPTDYVSPQAAIAAGLDPQKVYVAWSSALAKFPTQQAALAAGVPAGVVTSLWPASRTAAPPASASWLDQSTLGISNKWLVGGAAGIVLLASLRRR